MDTTRKLSAVCLAAGILLLTPLSALAADSFTAAQKGTGYFSKDNVIGEVKQGGKGEVPMSVPGAKVKIYDPKGTLVGEGMTDKHGKFDIDTSLEDLSGWTLTFEIEWDDTAKNVIPDALSGDITF